MGTTHTVLSISNISDRTKKTKAQFIIDTGATYSVVPKRILKKIDIKPEKEEEFIMMNGKTLKRKVGTARFEYHDKEAPARVIFGEAGDHTVLGVTTLENMGLGVDAVRRKIFEIPKYM